MVEYILGNYLIESGKITREQLKRVMEKEDSVEVTLGLAAVDRGILTAGQADEINSLIMTSGQSFEDAAMEKGYLTKEQAQELSKEKGNHYLMFMQELIDEGLVALDEEEWLLNDFGEKNGYNAEQIKDIKSDDVERIIPLLLPKEAEKFTQLVCTMVSTMIKSFNKHIYVGKAVMVDQLPAEDLVNQSLVWEEGIVDCFSERDGGLLMVSSVYGQEEYGQLDSEALDAAGELLNCINGLYVSGLSREGYFLEMMPPKYEQCSESIKRDSICRIPIFFDERGFYFTVAELV